MHLPPKRVPERRHNCNSCCTTQEKIPKGPAGGENVHCFSAVYNRFSNVQEKACYFLCFCVLASEVLLKAYNFASVQRKQQWNVCARVLNMRRKCLHFSLSCSFPCTNTIRFFQTEVLPFNGRVYLLNNSILSNLRIGKIPLGSLSG